MCLYISTNLSSRNLTHEARRLPLRQAIRSKSKSFDMGVCCSPIFTGVSLDFADLNHFDYFSKDRDVMTCRLICTIGDLDGAFDAIWGLFHGREHHKICKELGVERDCRIFLRASQALDIRT